MNEIIDSILNYDTKLTPQLRELTGAFYTPLSLAISMVEDAICYYLINVGYSKMVALSFAAGKTEPKTAKNILQQLSQLKFLDMASGTGVFGFARLAKQVEWQRFYQLENDTNLLKQTMQNMVLNDINATSVLQFDELIKQYFGVAFDGLLLSCDALLELTEKPQIKQIIESGGFDIIIGNPPYIGERGHTYLFSALKNNTQWSKFYQGKMDYSYFFVHQALNILSKEGVVTQIMTSYFTTADGATKLRNDIKNRASWRSIRYYDSLKAFKKVNALSFIIFTLSYKKNKQDKCDVTRNDQRFTTDNKALYSQRGDIQLIPSDYLRQLLKIEQNCRLTLGDVLAINQGLVSGADRFKQRHSLIIQQPFIVEKPIFVFENDEANDDQLLKPFLKNSDIKKYKLAKLPTRHVLYSARGNLKHNQKWLQHLAVYRPLLERRREVKIGARAWYELQWPRDEKIFLGPKIIAPQRSKSNTFAYLEAPFYGSADIYFLSAKPDNKWFNVDQKVLLKALTMYLNSKIISLWLSYKGKRKGQLLELYATPLKNIPLPDFSSEDITLLAHYYDGYIATEEQSIIDKSELIVNQYFNKF